jgi:hypothetical protein
MYKSERTDGNHNARGSLKYFTQRPGIHPMYPSKAIPIYKILYRPYLDG